MTPNDHSKLAVSGDKHRPVYARKLEKSYYEGGYINIIREYAHLFGEEMESIEVQLGDEGEVLHGHIDRHANKNKTPRICVGMHLREWFKANFDLMDIIYVVILSKTSIKLGKYLSDD